MVSLILYITLGAIQIVFAGWGGLVSAQALPAEERKQHRLICFGLGALGLVFTVSLGVSNYQSDQAASHDRTAAKASQDALTLTLNSSLQRQEYMRGQLESITVMMSKAGEKSADPAIGQLAGALARVADSTRVTSGNSVRQVQVSYKGAVLANGASLKSESQDPKVITIPSLQIKNIGNGTSSLSARWYFSALVNTGSSWQETPSDEAIAFPVLLWEGFGIPSSPQETWNTTDLVASLKGEPKYPVTTKLKVFYGGDRPLELVLMITR